MGDQDAAPPGPREGGKGEESEEKGSKFQKGDENSLWNGPVKNRKCTDIICIPIFIVHIIAFWFLTFQNAGTGDPMKLIRPRDYRGQFCGIGADSQWNSKMDLKNFKKLMWGMNMDETFDPVARDMVCSTVGYSAVVSPGLSINGIAAANKVTAADYNKYCGKAGSAMADAAAAVNKLQNDVNANIAKYSDPSKAYELFTKGASSGGTKMLKEMTKYFTMVCADSCNLGQNMSAARSYTYSPSPMTMWGTDPNFRAIGLWTKFVAELKANQPDLVQRFTFQAWDAAACPYDVKHCVPTPGVTFEEVSDWNLCYPKIDAGVMDAVGGAAADSLKGLATLSITEDAKKTFADTLADCLKTWQVFIIVAVLSFVIGIVTLILMRFILAPMVWISLLLVFLLFIGCGLAILVRSSQCANQGFVDAANSQAAATQASGAAGTAANPFKVECAGGWAIENSDARKAAEITGYVILGMGGVWALGVLIMVCRIRLAIAVNQVACQFLYNNPQVLFVPILQNLIGVLWVFVWCYTAAFLLSQVSEDNVPTKAYATYAEAYGTTDKQGACTGAWPSGDVFVDESDALCTGTSPLCYKCSSPRFWFDYKFGYSFLSFLWQNFFMVALGQVTVAGAVGIWFFTPSGEKWKRATVMVAFKNGLFYHSGSLAFGSLILAIIVWLKWFMTWLAQQAKQTKNKVMEIVCKVLAYCLYCFEKCVKFLNKNAYIQTALMGTNFCTSAKNAFFLILRNALRFGVICMLSHIVHFIGMVLIIAATAVSGYFILGAMYSDVNPIVPTILYAFIGFFTAKFFIGTFGLAVDATLQCFIAAEEMDAGNDFAPGPLKAFINDNADQKSKCCDTCCCTIM